ncbi:MAG TPA: tetratricopeptide repeat protein [Thermoanaerobaculia bacterium]|jgi:tetratricopeptide (TPR) repeat protein|nr:tetratricopeptide repeat protein [Thermoanaerobaculia bacterium]
MRRAPTEAAGGTRAGSVLAAGRRAAFGLFVLGCLSLSGCATTGSFDRTDLVRKIRDRGLDPERVVIPFEVTPEMKDWALKAAPEGLPLEIRLDRLFNAVLLDLKPAYVGGRTTTAPVVFAERQANCLGFTSLLVGLARSIGIPTFYLAIDDIERFSRDGDLVVISNHVSAAFNTGAQTRVLDFSVAPVTSYRDARALDDLSAVGLYYSNLGAEKLRTGDLDAAIELLRTSVALAPDISGARINLGVTLRRRGDQAGAEAEYRAALEADPQASSAYQNLAALLRQRGDAGEAEELLRISEHQGTKNPYSFLSLGDLALARGRLDEARRFYRRALGLYRENAEPYAAMGQWAFAKGNRDEAKKWLKKARAIEPENDRVERLERRLSMPAPPTAAQ